MAPVRVMLLFSFHAMALTPFILVQIIVAVTAIIMVSGLILIWLALKFTIRVPASLHRLALLPIVWSAA